MIEFRKEYFADERDDNLNEIGKPTQRQDALGHVTGRSPYYDDHLFDGLLHIRCVRSPHHHARVRRIDTSEADRMPGVVRIVLGKDVPQNLNTLLSLLDFGLDDEPLISEKKVSYKGEPVAAVIAESDRAARDAVAKVRVDWEELPAVFDVEDAVKPGAPVVNEIYPGNLFVYHGKYDHQKLRFGDVEAGFRQADRIIEGRYQMSPIEQAPTETCGAIAAPETNDRYVVYTSTQALFFSLDTTSKLLKMPSNRLHFIGGTVGGGFGGKVDSLHEPMAVLGTVLTGRPCKYMFDREEEMQVGAPRGAERWYIKDGVMNDGRIVARKFIGYFDSGAYTRLSSYAIIKGVGHLPGPYTIPNVYADVYCVFTNRTPATAMRGFGITGVDFAIEAHMDKISYEVGVDPIELRILNAYRDGDMKAHRRLAKNTALIECCQVAAEKAKWPLSRQAQQASSLRDGGGARAEMPPHTAIDHNGAVTGFTAGSYARGNKKPGQAQPVSMPQMPRHETAPVTPRYEPAARPQPQPAPVATQPAPPPPAQTAADARRTRFSSISGLRRR
ncbi:molybdopterin cofactor-binding domain-containing protein [Aquamicrobium sp. LC103]|uniref:xanthine dehydrogenase family protein molybdopterin-binding subunit n=1 Tax=Aquamicrobium sp. LC103 TaxID=1120658 RepID=UPI00063ECC4D|nr:molybdopterin cofactor-binding domain-containing protein [Aquamicrobium sp. LC103]TKT76216.1 xanthine dehydrogenase family protein molybdopterin-binding subunit [Aquamicrobium sp. LC103]